MEEKKIKINRCKCLLCNAILESKHRHDFNTCECGNLSVDGGKDYLKRSAHNFKYTEDLSEMYEDIDDEIYSFYTNVLRNNGGDTILAKAETSLHFIEDEEFIEEIIDRFENSIEGDDNA